MRLPRSNSTTSIFKDFLTGTTRATAGSVAVWVAMSTPVLVGGATLSVDMARVYNVDADLQSAADALSRAGAAELDQRGDATTRASRAILQLLSHEEKFAKGSSAIEVDTITYFKQLPANDYEDIPTSYRTTNASEARYVEVKIKPKDVATIFPSSFMKKLTDTTLDAHSVAGMDEVVCGTAPVFICNPREGLSETIYEAMEDPAFKRTQFKLKTPNNVSDPYGRGNFGWLDPFGGNSGASKLADAIAIDIPPTCYSQSKGVVLRTGNIASMSAAVNTRFDIYEGSFKKYSSDPRYAPAENVVKGYGPPLKGNGQPKKNASGCDSLPSPQAFAMPRDTCFNDSTCSSRQGTGAWDFNTYMQVNHPGFHSITLEGVTYSKDNLGQFTTRNPPSRYSLYRWEIDNNCIPGAKTYGSNAITPEEGTPQCHSSGHSTTVADRRVITVAVLNCLEIESSSAAGMSKQSGPLPVETFVKVFLTEPMGAGQENVIYGEIVGPLVKGKDSEANELVAVVR
ncbi:Tad domain-containing protein [Litorimonas sp. WD9-15]|uniref:Tad domain-containing protein n=1 Tax=Litorimonas sp. WD9-15 TaxID=3418716 RepID=UPI003CFDE9B2